jgi:hypothetical protein
MEQQNNINNFDTLLKSAGDFAETKIELWKLKLIDKTSDTISSIVSRVIVLIFALLFFIILNIGLALWVGELAGKNYLGFFIVGGFYALVCLIIYALKNKFIKTPVTNMMLKKMLTPHDYGNN